MFKRNKGLAIHFVKKIVFPLAFILLLDVLIFLFLRDRQISFHLEKIVREFELYGVKPGEYILELFGPNITIIIGCLVLSMAMYYLFRKWTKERDFNDDKNVYLEYPYWVFCIAKFYGYKSIDMTEVPVNMQMKLTISGTFANMNTRRLESTIQDVPCDCSVAYSERIFNQDDVHILLGDTYNISVDNVDLLPEDSVVIINSNKEHIKKRDICHNFQKKVNTEITRLMKSFSNIHIYPFLSAESVQDVVNTSMMSANRDVKVTVYAYQPSKSEFHFDKENRLKIKI